MQKPLEWELSAKGGLSEVKLRLVLRLSSKEISCLLKRLDRAVGVSRQRSIGKVTRKEVLAVGTRITRADLNSVKLLRSVVLKRCRAGLRRSSTTVMSPAPPLSHWGGKGA